MEDSNIINYYDIENTVSVINTEQAKRIALQFPDLLLSDADQVTFALRSKLESDTELYILGDTTVCPCCVDTVAVEHIKADLVIHYGDACMSKVEDIPVYYAFEHTPIDIDSFICSFRERFGGSKKTIYLSYDLSYYYCIHTIYEAIKEFCPTILLGEVIRSQNLSSSHSFAEGHTKMGYHYFPTSTIDSDGIIVFLGKDGMNFTNYYDNGNVYSILLDSGISQAFVYSDYQFQTININKFLMQRYVQIERFEHLEMIGVIAGTLSVNRYRDIIHHISNLAESHDQTLYTFMIGKLNLPKLANFPGIEGFILIGCERSCFLDTREYPFPILTPYEYEIAIGERSWENIYIHDYTKCLREDEGVEGVTEEYDGQIIAFESRVLDYINEQQYHGLEQKGDIATPAILKKGQAGIPSCYENELF